MSTFPHYHLNCLNCGRDAGWWSVGYNSEAVFCGQCSARKLTALREQLATLQREKAQAVEAAFFEGHEAGRLSRITDGSEVDPCAPGLQIDDVLTVGEVRRAVREYMTRKRLLALDAGGESERKAGG